MVPGIKSFLEQFPDPAVTAETHARRRIARSPQEVESVRKDRRREQRFSDSRERVAGKTRDAALNQAELAIRGVAFAHRANNTTSTAFGGRGSDGADRVPPA
jgi:hypothetical protein